jgi:hypothetical protein
MEAGVGAYKQKTQVVNPQDAAARAKGTMTWGWPMGGWAASGAEGGRGISGRQWLRSEGTGERERERVREREGDASSPRTIADPREARGSPEGA